jgi:hypothetical protein
VVPGVSVPTGLPPCPGLRGEPCRGYQALANLPAAPVPPGTGGESSSSNPGGTAGTGAGGGGSTLTTAPPPAKHLKCRKGFRKKKTKHHRTVCKKVKRHRHKHHHHRHDR